MLPIYRLESVTHRYGGMVALDIPSLSLFEGSLYLLAGPNGAGKSTLLSVLAFLLPPSEGAVFYRGGKVDAGTSDAVRVRREITLLHQSPYLFDDTVFGNVAFGLSARGIRGNDLRRKVARALDTVGLGGFERRNARLLSGGEAQRIAMARALALSPRILLLDEPMAGVDRETAEWLRDVIVGLPGTGTTVVMATHGEESLAGPEWRILRMENGRMAGLRQPEPGRTNLYGRSAI